MNTKYFVQFISNSYVVDDAHCCMPMKHQDIVSNDEKNSHYYPHHELLEALGEQEQDEE
jgi:hypothetical protein